MPIINTLLTIVDKFSPTMKTVADNTEKSKKKINTSLDGVVGKTTEMESAFNSMSHTSINSFGDVVSTINRVKTAMAASESGIAKYAMAFTLIGGGLTAAAAATISAINSSAEYVRSLRQVSNASGVSIEYLQKIAKAFNDTGLSIEKFGDLNKDTLDHLGDAYRDGSGPADDMKANGLKLNEYNKYLTKTNGGLEALIHTYFKLRDAGKNNAVITNQMETLASDSSHLVSTLKEFRTEQDALNSIMSEHAGVSAEVAQKYKEWDKQINTLSTTFSVWKVNALTPVIDDINDLFQILQGQWDQTNFFQTFSKEGFGAGIKSFLSSMQMADPTSAMAMKFLVKPFIDKKDADNVKKEIQPEQAADAKVDKNAWQKPKKDESGKLDAQKKQAAEYLSNLDKSIATERNKTDVQYTQDLKKLDEFQKKKVLSQSQYQRGVEMLNTKLKRSVDDEFYKQQETVLTQHHDAMLISEADYQLRMDEIKNSKDKESLSTDYVSEIEALKYEHESKLTEESDYQQKLLDIKSYYSDKEKDLSKNYESISSKDAYSKQAESLSKYNTEVNRGIDLASGFADAIANSAEQGSTAWVVATVASKALMVAQAIMAANLAGVQAAATTPGGPAAQAAAAESITMWGYAQAALIAAQGIQTVAGAREKGGSVDANKTYLVGEKGPELFTVPGTGGQITSNANLQKAIGGSSDAQGDTKFEQTVVIQGSSLGADDVGAIKSMTETIIDKKFAEKNRKSGG